MQDSVEINKSLFTLRKVILALSEGKGAAGHVPYRDSTLTRLLKRSLGGSCHTLMIACLSPDDIHVEENHSTLAYATRARAITNVPVVNLDPRAAKVRALQQEVANLKTEIARLIQLLQLGGASLPPEVLAQLSALAEGAGCAAGCAAAAGGGLRFAVGGAALGHAKQATQPTACGINGRGAQQYGGGDAVMAHSVATLQRAGAGGVGAANGGSIAVQHGLELARQLAATNSKLRQAFDTLELQYQEMERAHAALMQENGSLRERLSLAELTLAMESYPTAPPDSLLSLVQARLRQAALEALQLRAENAALSDQAAANPVSVPRSAHPNAQFPPRDAYPNLHPSHRGFSSDQGGRGRSRRPSRGLSCAGAVEEPLRTPEPAGPARNVLSSTGGFNLAALSSFDVPPPPSPSRALGPPPPTLEELVGHGPPQQGNTPTRTMPRLVQPASTFKELDELSALLRKRAALKAVQRPSTATTRAAGGTG
jgi:hypothetical protein